MRAVAIGAVLLMAVAAAVIAANFFLLSFALDRHDPVGRLSPKGQLGQPPAAPPGEGEAGDD